MEAAAHSLPLGIPFDYLQSLVTGVVPSSVELCSSFCTSSPPDLSVPRIACTIDHNLWWPFLWWPAGGEYCGCSSPHVHTLTCPPTHQPLQNLPPELTQSLQAARHLAPPWAHLRLQVPSLCPLPSQLLRAAQLRASCQRAGGCSRRHCHVPHLSGVQPKNRAAQELIYCKALLLYLPPLPRVTLCPAAVIVSFCLLSTVLQQLWRRPRLKLPLSLR